MSAQVERYLEYIDRGFEKDTWHMALLKSLEGLTAEQAAWAPQGRHSIRKIVNHVALWKEVTADRFAGLPPRPEGCERDVDWAEIEIRTEEAKHDSYHCGQIHLLRALQGIPSEW